ncbi:MAG: M28 family peptidase [bacterium]|nr:M28 family peptidase [bacterium]
MELPGGAGRAHGRCRLPRRAGPGRRGGRCTRTPARPRRGPDGARLRRPRRRFAGGGLGRRHVGGLVRRCRPRACVQRCLAAGIPADGTGLDRRCAGWPERRERRCAAGRRRDAGRALAGRRSPPRPSRRSRARRRIPPAAGNYYPGANDNASGIAIVHELASRLASAPAAGDRRSVLFLNLDAEEVGLQGAAWFVNHAPVVLDSVDVMINLDTVGRLSDGRLIVSGIGTAEPLAAAVDQAASATAVNVNASRGGWSGSDHMVFNTREVPVLFLFGGPYPEYNRPTDDAAALDYPAMARVADFATALVNGLRAVPGYFAWQMVAGGGLRDEADAPAGAGNRQTWLGTMPDFTEGQTGYRLAGVFDGSPAAAAGLEKGDLLVRFGDYPVSDLGTFTTALRAYAPGDLVEVGIVRNGRDLHFTVALGDRAQRR